MLTRIKSFRELTSSELYEILKLRQTVFIIEQKIIYHDIDGKDNESLHFWIEDEDSKQILGYLRMILDEQARHLSIGRVLTTPEARGKGVARQLIQTATHYAMKHCHSWPLTLHAQEYLYAFYKSLGFIKTGPAFCYPNEDPLPHIPMKFKL